MAKLVLFVLQRARHAGEELLSEIDTFTDTADELVEDARGAADMAVVLRYIVYVSGLAPTRLREVLRDARNPQIREAIMKTTAEQLKDEGRAEGEARGQARMFEKMLTLKFGALSPELQTRLRSATLVELDRWLEQSQAAKNVDDVFA